MTLGTRLEHRTIFNLAQSKVRHDLASAWMVYHEKLNDIRDIVRSNVLRESLQHLIVIDDRETLFKYLERVNKDFGLDVLTLTDATGKVLIRSAQSAPWGDDRSQDPLVARAIKGETVAATHIIPMKELIKENKALADQVYLKIIPTPKSAPTAEEYIEDGMMLMAAAPIYNEEQTLLGCLYGGILLNQNYEIVDRVKDIVFKGEKYQGREIGSATIFQYDLRISTNVKREDGGRAIGTRVSQEVKQAVLQEGKPWIDRAFVVNEWYITAYEPIKNVNEEIVGILYVGMLEKPYIDLRNKVMLTFTGVAIVCVIILLVVLSFITSSIIRPLQDMVKATNKIARGDLNHRVGIEFQDEVGQLAQSFNSMTDELKKANAKLVQWGKTLEKRVEQRTQELQNMQNYMIQSEKMASLGKMAAGVAHEINNPLTSILINAHLLMEKTDKNSSPYESLNLIAEETTRCSDIVKGLLEFSRQSPPQKNLVNINHIISHIISILENQMGFQNITIQKKLGENLPAIEVDENKIKQVFWNLMINAGEAMPEGGLLIITSRISSTQQNLEIAFKDTGVGIKKENMSKLFDPFFTTKSGGTGLGLAVIYGIVQQHGGKIDVQSEVSKGSTFIISLPLQSTG